MSATADSSKSADTKHSDGSAPSSSAGPNGIELTKDGKVKKPRTFFGGKPGPRGAKGKPKRKPMKPLVYHLGLIPNQVITKLSRSVHCQRVSKKGKLSFVNEWGYAALKLMRHAEKNSRANGRKKTIEFMDIAQAVDFFPHLRKYRLINKDYKKSGDVDTSNAKRPVIKHPKKTSSSKKEDK